MNDQRDTYKTLSKPSKEILLKEKKSKFFGYAFPVQNEKEIKLQLEKLRRKHATANHICYAWQLGVESKRYRANDDGEPNNSAGMPIYRQLQAFEVTNALVAIVRIFGGTKLGVGGLITAYRTASQMALEASTVIEKVQEVGFKLSFEYAAMDMVMRVIKQRKLDLLSQEMSTDCSLIISVRKNEADAIQELFESKPILKIQRLES